MFDLLVIFPDGEAGNLKELLTNLLPVLITSSNVSLLIDTTVLKNLKVGYSLGIRIPRTLAVEDTEDNERVVNEKILSTLESKLLKQSIDVTGLFLKRAPGWSVKFLAHRSIAHNFSLIIFLLCLVSS